MRARDLMTSPVHTVRDVDAVSDLAALLAQHGIAAAPVLDAEGTLVGLAGPPPDGLLGKVSEVMRPPLSVTPDTDVAEVARVLLDERIPSVPVLDGGCLVGVVSRRDVLSSLVPGDGLIRREVQRRLDAYTGAEPRWVAQVAGGVVYLSGEPFDDTEETIVTVLARTVTGVRRVEFGDRQGERHACG